MTVLKLRHQPVEKMIHVNVWAGENPDRMYWSGRLMLKPKDWDALLDRLDYGEGDMTGVSADVIVEQGP
jgi:hypothetical protein